MKTSTLTDLQASVQDKTAFKKLADYEQLASAFLAYLAQIKPTRIISPSHNNYVFYQYAKNAAHKITRPLNTNLFIDGETDFKNIFVRFVTALGDIKRRQQRGIASRGLASYGKSGEINKVIYTAQQAIGCIGDSLANENQSRKRTGQLFEKLVKLVLQEVGLKCEPRTINLPIPGFPDCKMSYELDVVFSRDQAIVASETKHIHPREIVGSVKTTSKDRIDKIFLDKYLLTKLLGRDIPMIAVFLHDVQRARRGSSIFGINSTFNGNHFLGYTVALNRLDGVYYIDPRPEMVTNMKLREQIADFQKLLFSDLWKLTNR
ncbi:MAG: hypothetical protein LBM04_06335 [Opitutaceae bacterium]|jgi:hypothetical protein|nr:hypothetical protein [Opitutaceae bacterium]